MVESGTRRELRETIMEALEVQDQSCRNQKLMFVFEDIVAKMTFYQRVLREIESQDRPGTQGGHEEVEQAHNNMSNGLQRC